MPRIGTREGYDLWAGSYDAFENPMVALTEWAMDRRPLPARGRDVLELGCGTGRNAARVLAAGAASYRGVDNSEGMLERARARSAGSRASWQQATLGEPLPLEAASVDFVLVALVLEHFDAVAPVLREIARLLRPGGAYRILEIHAGLVEGGTQAHFWHEGQEHSLPSFPHEGNEFLSAASAAGLAAPEIHEWTADQAVVHAIPKLARHAGRAVLLDVTGA